MALGGPAVLAVPDFSPTAHGGPADWNIAGNTVYWGKRSSWRFPVVSGARADVATIQEFLRRRRGPNGVSVLELLGPPKATLMAGAASGGWATTERRR